MKNLTSTALITILFFSIIFTTGCSKDDTFIDEEIFDGSLKSIEAFYTPELLTAIKELGITLNTGNEPPNVEGHFFSTPFILKKSTVPNVNDFVGKVFSDYELTLSNQKNDILSIDYFGQTSSGSQKDLGKGTFISGNGNNFSIFLKTESTKEKNDTKYMAVTAQVISGTISSQGIKNLQIAFMMLDDNGDPEDLFIPNNTGRLIYDSDMISPLYRLKNNKNSNHENTTIQLQIHIHNFYNFAVSNVLK